MAEGMRCELRSWQEVYDLALELAFRIRDDGFDSDQIVAIGRGGYAPGRLLADFLHKKALSSFRVQHYTAGAHREREARVVGSFDADLPGARVLLVDDVNDSGETLEAATAFLGERGAAEVRTAVLQEKETTSFHADYVGDRVETWRWIIYPWAVVEDVTGFLADMDPRPEGVAAAARALEAGYGIRPPDAMIEAVFRLWPDAAGEAEVDGDPGPETR